MRAEERAISDDETRHQIASCVSSSSGNNLHRHLSFGTLSVTLTQISRTNSYPSLTTHSYLQHRRPNILKKVTHKTITLQSLLATVSLLSWLTDPLLFLLKALIVKKHLDIPCWTFGGPWCPKAVIHS